MSRPISILAAGCLLLLPATFSFADFDRGQALFDDHCRECHEDQVFSRADHKAKNLQELQRRVAGWSVHSGLDWTEEDVNDVVRYLDHRYYRFTGQP